MLFVKACGTFSPVFDGLLTGFIPEDIHFRPLTPKTVELMARAGLVVEAWPFYRTIPGVRLCWELEEPKGPKVCTIMTAHETWLRV